MITMKGVRNYLLIALLVVLLIGFIVAGKTSPIYKAPIVQTINCNSVNLGFNYTTGTSLKALEGTSENTFDTIIVNNLGNVTEDISLNVIPVGNAPFYVKAANSTDVNVNKKISTQFVVYSPLKTGNYSVVANLSAGYLNCVNYKIIPINVTVVNSTS
jgi:hypothetical protein